MSSVRNLLQRLHLAPSKISENEKDLAKELRNLCYTNGREIDQRESAKILHKLGLEYKAKSPDKVSLIQSAALLNAAIVRGPENVEKIKEDLKNLCAEVLLKAEAKNKDENLMEAAIDVKEEVMKMREMTNHELRKLKQIRFDVVENELYELERQKIADIQNLQENIHDQYKAIMQNLSKYCSSVMGEPPSKCKFALVGMGSLARKEITPYSDFENIIVLENGAQYKLNYRKIRKYFRWFSLIFQIILINMGETIIPSVAIPSLNDFSKLGESWFHDAFTTRGICFDGMMPHACKFPLGRQPSENKPWKTELIKPVNEMLHYLETEEDLKNGYNLADILTKTCMVYGDTDLYNKFKNGVDSKLLKQQTKGKFFKRLQEQVNEDKVKFSIEDKFEEIYEESKFNIKHFIYRSSTIFISALGKLYGIDATSCFEIISKLAQKGLIKELDEHKLKYATAVACEVRLKFYMKKERQDDLIHHSESQQTELAEIIGKKSIIDYFIITIKLQESLPSFNIENITKSLKFTWHHDSKLLANLFFTFHFYEECISQCQLALQSEDELKWGIRLEKLQNYLVHFYRIGACMMNMGRDKEALEKFEQELNIRKQISADETTDDDIANSMCANGICRYNMGKHEEALQQLEEALTIRKKISNDETTDVKVANTMSVIGVCMNRMGKHEKALQQFEQELTIRKKISNDKTKDVKIANTRLQIGICMSSMGKYKEALQQFEQELTIRRKISYDETTDVKVANTMYQIGICTNKMGKHKEALQQFKQELNIRKKISNDKTMDKDIADSMYQIGICMKTTRKHEEALQQFEEELIIRKKISNDETTDEDIADSMYQIGICMKTMRKHEEALQQFEQELTIRKKISNDETTDVKVANTVHQIGICMNSMGKHHIPQQQVEQEQSTLCTRL